MSKYKLAALDMDGTLLNSQKNITPSTIETIKKALKLNKYIVLSTGRALDELRDYHQQLTDIPYGILASGALIYDFKDNKIIHHETFLTSQINKIFKAINQENIMIHFFSSGRSIVSKKDISNMDKYQMSIYQPMFKRVATTVDDIIDYAKNHPIEKINLYHQNEAARAETFEKLKDLSLSFAFAETTSLEISPSNVTKGKGLIKLCDFLDIELSKTIAVGDADNDLDVLKTAGLAVAMKNANDNVKKICDVIVADNDHDGCKEAIEKYLIK